MKTRRVSLKSNRVFRSTLSYFGRCVMTSKNTIIERYIALIEKIANGKNNTLSFAGKDMTFYRGEIHIIKKIGDDPGIFSS